MSVYYMLCYSEQCTSATNRRDKLEWILHAVLYRAMYITCCAIQSNVHLLQTTGTNLSGYYMLCYSEQYTPATNNRDKLEWILHATNSRDKLE